MLEVYSSAVDFVEFFLTSRLEEGAWFFIYLFFVLYSWLNGGRQACSWDVFRVGAVRGRWIT